MSAGNDTSLRYFIIAFRKESDMPSVDNRSAGGMLLENVLNETFVVLRDCAIDCLDADICS